MDSKNIIILEIRKILEATFFQADGAEEMARSQALYKLPRMGIAQNINNFNQIEMDSKNKQTEEDKEDVVDQLFDQPTPEHSARVATNMYENNYLNPQPNPIQQPLDAQSLSPFIVNKGTHGEAVQSAIDYFNDNIARDLHQVKYPGDTEGMKPPSSRIDQL